MSCLDCGEKFSKDMGRYYHMEANCWLCDGCYDDRFRNNEE